MTHFEDFEKQQKKKRNTNLCRLL